VRFGRSASSKYASISSRSLLNGTLHLNDSDIRGARGGAMKIDLADRRPLVRVMVEAAPFDTILAQASGRASPSR